MELNIALNTIVYLMLFLFPGILFRKFYYRAAHSKQFDHGNLFERFLWTMLSSIFMLILVTLFFLFVKYFLELPLLNSFSYSTIKEIFDSLSVNNLPAENEIESTYKDFLTFISALYFLSMLFGILAYFINAKILNIFRYNNYWEGVLKGTYKKKISNDLLFGFTQADVLVDSTTDSNLYSGRVVDYFLSPQTNQLETIVLAEVSRYKKIYDEKGVQIDTILRTVPGDNFCIDNTKVLNINLTYVYQAKADNTNVKRLCLAIDMLYGLGLLSLFLSLYLDLNWVVVSTIPKKFVFFILGWIILDNIFRIFKMVINGQTEKIKLEYFLVFVIFIIPFLWLFNILTWWAIIIIEVVALFVIGFIINLNKNK